MAGLQVRTRRVDVASIVRRNRFDFAVMYLGILGVGLFVAGVIWKRSFQPYIGYSTTILFFTWLAWFVWPRLGLKLTLFLALLGDTRTVSWFPFNKNLSSEESIFWVHDGFSVSPLELTLGVALLAVPIRRWAEGRRPFARGDLVVPAVIAFGAILFGMANGLSQGGDLRIALYEARPLMYFPVVYLLTVSVCHHVEHYRHLLYTAVGGIFLQSVLSVQYTLNLPARERAELATLTEHGSSISMNLLFLAAICSLVIRGCPWFLRVALVVASLPAAWIYLLSQRRTAFLTLAIALGMFAFVLFWRQRRTFWLVVPVLLVLMTGYVGAFWNGTGPAAFPAQAIKTAIAPGELSAADQQSDVYRSIENFNLQATIRSSPAQGTGFGLKFLRPIPLADISFFEFYEYIPHNSLLWLWIKMGIIGMVAFLYIFARAIVSGVERIRGRIAGVDLLTAFCGVAFVVMFAIFVFVDIAWEARNSVLLGVCLGICTLPREARSAELADVAVPQDELQTEQAEVIEPSSFEEPLTTVEAPVSQDRDRDPVHVSRIDDADDGEVKDTTFTDAAFRDKITTPSAPKALAE